MADTTVTYAPRHDATPEAEISALASVYRFVLDAAQSKEGSCPGAPEDAKGPKHDRAKRRILH
jgi:hypothetical protein